MKLNMIYLVSMAIVFTSCYSTHRLTPSYMGSQPKKAASSRIAYSIDIDEDGIFEVIEIDENNRPQPIQGYDQWLRDFYGSIEYPVYSRENGIDGTVLLNILVNKIGEVKDVGIIKSISSDIDFEAKRAYVNSTQKGYIPLKINGIPTSFRIELPVGFRIQ